MPTLEYPSSLPGPQLAPFDPAERRDLSEGYGPREARAFQRDRLGTQRLQFKFKPPQALEFKEWVDTALIFGGRWFAAPWRIPPGGIAVRRFIMETQQWDFLATGHWLVSIDCEVRGRGELPFAPGVASDGSELIGYLTAATWYPRAGPVFVDASGITMHCLTFVLIYERGVQIQRLSHSGVLTNVSSYINTHAAPTANEIGNLDIDGLIIYVASPLKSMEVFIGSGGTPILLTAPVEFGVVRWAKRDANIYVSVSVPSVYRFSTAGTLLATNNSLSGQPQCIVADENSLYVIILSNPTIISVLDKNTLTVTGTIPVPVNITSRTLIMCSSAGLFFVQHSSGLYKRSAGGWELINSNLGGCSPGDQTTGLAILDRLAMYGNTLYRVVLPTSENPAGAAVYRTVLI